MSATPHREPRKKPLQARSRATVEVLLDATARVLVQQGFVGASTNRIAEVAGISIGSLYQYFPSKDALVSALRKRHAEQMRILLRARCQDVLGTTLPTAVQTLVHALVEAHQIDPQLHRVMGEQVPRPVSQDGAEDIGIDMQTTLKALLLVYRKDILPTDLDLTSLVLVRTVEALVHAAVEDPTAQTKLNAMEREIQILILRYLTGSG